MITATESHSLRVFFHGTYVPSRLEISAGAVRQIEVAIRQLEHWAGRRLSVYDLNEDLIRRFLADFRASHAAATTNSRRRDLLALWNCAFAESLLDRPPRYSKVPKAKAYPRIPEAWTPSQVAAIIEASQADRIPIGGIIAPLWWRALILVLFDSAARLGELLAVAPRDLSLTDRWVLFRETKSGKQRLAAIHAETAEACRRIYNVNRPLLFPLHHSRQQLDRKFRRILLRAGIQPPPGRLFRLFRITSGSLIEAAGGDGAKHLGNGRRVFEAHYLDPRVMPSQLGLLPRPR